MITWGAMPTQVNSLDVEARRARGNRLLELYFYQIEHQGAALLDLRSASFSGEDTLTRWAPAPLYCEWSPTFIDGVRKLYRGFTAIPPAYTTRRWRRSRSPPPMLCFDSILGRVTSEA